LKNPGYSITENITVTFSSPTEYTVTSDQGATGTQGIGYVNQTFISSVTGVRFTILNPADATWVQNPYSFANGDVLRFEVNKGGNFIVSQTPTIQVPGMRIVVSDTLDIDVEDTAILETYNKSGREPDVGSFYYTSYKYEKEDYEHFLNNYPDKHWIFWLYRY